MDFLKFQTNNQALINYLFSHKLLDWESDNDKLNPFDKEVITTKKVRQYNGIIFNFYKNRLDIIFRPHYYFNNNLHNANDIKIIECINIIKEFQKKIGIDLRELKVVNLEFGINIISPIDIEDLINSITYHGKNEFKSNLPFSKISSKPTKKGISNKYKIIKAYAKGKQFPEYCDINTFRFEIKSKEAKFIKTLGIRTAEDLLNINIYSHLSNLLINEFKEVLILDYDIDLSELTRLEQEKIKEYNNPHKWYKINKKNHRNSFNNNKKRYYTLINKVENNLKNKMTKLISEKLEYLKQAAPNQSREA
ncbi:hypothetical protein EQG63_11880 [Flavobacterium amnicola]|uniref:Uncharacterized protein n=1 Tax=Flavobacterium amnicola TaxID=2506422 RepID=A0A4Q1K1N3_9FLAO|nr:hypothetical protein [Flavobacterium amnicola]RXR16314.1 hypothetical protein EQG63_11880 [Flavobacterium amnicola]